MIFSFYNPQILTDEVERIRTFYQRQGFLYSKVTADVIPVRKNDKRVDIVFQVIENSPIMVDTIEIKFSGGIPPNGIKDKIKTEFNELSKLVPESRFVDDDLLYDQALLKKVASENGFAL